jgi:hypothetical protein
MWSPMLAVPAEPTSASLVQGSCCDVYSAVHEKYEVKFNPVHMTWVLIDDTNGKLRAQARWVLEG